MVYKPQSWEQIMSVWLSVVCVLFCRQMVEISKSDDVQPAKSGFLGVDSSIMNYVSFNWFSPVLETLWISRVVLSVSSSPWHTDLMQSGLLQPDDSEWDEFGNDLYAIPEVLPVHQASNPIQDIPPPSKADEDSKIKALIDTPALDWQR